MSAGPPLLLFGLGTEGEAALRYLRGRGLAVIGVDRRGPAALDGMPADIARDLQILTEGEAEGLLTPQMTLWRSPGIPPSHELIAAAHARGAAVTTPTGHWVARFGAPDTVTVTGTKGKSTTVTLTAAILTALGHPARAYGNIGTPPLDHPPAPGSAAILEVSSYMMEDLPPAPGLHVVTNLYRDHTPWHGGVAAYHAAKLRPFRADPPQRGLAPLSVIAEKGLPRSVRALEDVVPLTEAGELVLGGRTIAPARINPAFGHHGSRLALRAGAAVARSLHGDEGLAEAVEASAAGFAGLPSRQEIVPSGDGRIWINDALATVPEATLGAVAATEGPLLLLIGGADRGQDWAALAGGIGGRADLSVILFGSVRRDASAALERAGVPFETTGTYDEALDLAPALVRQRGARTVLFSPCAASEPPDRDFRARADKFRRAARGLPG